MAQLAAFCICGVTFQRQYQDHALAALLTAATAP
jgi:hypothetical protein